MGHRVKIKLNCRAREKIVTPSVARPSVELIFELMLKKKCKKISPVGADHRASAMTASEK